MVPLLKAHIESSLTTLTPLASMPRLALDVGCGEQPFRPLLESLGYQYLSLDVDQNAAGTVDFIGAIDEPLPPELTSHGPFQLVLCTEVLEHVADWDCAFMHLSRLVAKHGKLVITCPHFYQLHEEPYDFWRPTPHALRFYAKRSNLRVVSLDAVGTGWDVLGTLLANCYAQPVDKRFLSRLASRTVSELRRYTFALLRGRYLQRLVRLQSSLYLSNIAILERS